MNGQLGSRARARKDLVLMPVHFGDVDEFSDWENSLGWDIESVQLSAGENTISFDNFTFPEMLVGHFRSHQRMQNVFAVPDGVMVFLISRQKQQILWNGTEFPPTLMGLVRSCHSHWAVLPPGFDCYEFMVSEDLIRRSDLFPPQVLARSKIFEHAFVPLPEPETGEFLLGMDNYFRLARDAKASQTPDVNQDEFYEFILHGLMQVIDAGLAMQTIRKPRLTRRPDLVFKTRDLFLGNLTEDWTAEKVAEALGVSYRVLNYAFKETVGVSPYKYLLNERLQEVRRRLKADRQSITEICYSLGFYTPSRFSHQYSRLFGELPSQTRRWHSA